MVTTFAAWVAGIVLVGTCASPVRFERVMGAVTGARAADPRARSGSRAPEHPLTRTARLVGLGVGVVCLVLGVLGGLAVLGAA